MNKMIVNLQTANKSMKRYNKLMKDLKSERLEHGVARYKSLVCRFVLPLSHSTDIANLRFDFEDIPVGTIIIIEEFACSPEIQTKFFKLLSYIFTCRGDVETFIISQRIGV